MSAFHIVSDSAASFSHPRIIEQYPLTILPIKIDIGGQQYREGVDLTADEIMRVMATQPHPPTLVPPSVQEYEQVFAQVSRSGKNIISLHPSRAFSDSWQHARTAAQRVDDTIMVIDTGSICAGQGMLIRVAGECARQGLDFETTIHKVRSAIDRTFALYYVDEMPYLYHQQMMSQSRMLLGSYLNIKTFLSLEDGQLRVVAKARSRTHAADRLLEFLTEFDRLDDAIIVQNRSHITEQTRHLQDRLTDAFPGRHFPYTMYNASLATLVGATATGIAVLESETTNIGKLF